MRDKPLKKTSNATVYGGSISTDIVVIEFDQEPARKSRWEKVFEEAYGLSLRGKPSLQNFVASQI